MKKKYPTVKCPYCFTELKYNNVVFRNMTGAMKVDQYLLSFNRGNGNAAYSESKYSAVDPATLPHTDLNSKKGFLSGVRNPDRTLGDYLEERLCPYCHNSLLKNFGRDNIKYIAVVGVPNSGKTTYLAAVNDRLQKKDWLWGSLDSEQSGPLDILTAHYTRNQADARTATKGVQGPYIYHLQNNIGDHKFDECQLVFFDVPGEVYANAANINTHMSNYLLNADGIVFIINSAAAIESKGDVNVKNILDAFLQTGITSNKKTAIIFNKLDKVKKDLELSSEDIERFIPQATDETIDDSAIELQSNTIKGIMLKKGAHDKTATQQALTQYMLNVNQVFGEDCRIFATRLITENESGSYVFKSEGAETPFLWLLSELGVFPKKAAENPKNGK